MNRACFGLCLLASLLASCGGANSPDLAPAAAPTTPATSSSASSTYAQTVTYGIVDIDLIKQRDRASSILKDVQDGRQTA